MNAMGLTIKPVETDEELRVANNLIADIQVSEEPEMRRWLEDFGARYPGFRREHTRIALYRGELAGALRMNTETIRIGEARLKMGGLGWVSTTERHRRKGICTALLSDVFEYMREHNYHVSMLFGIPDFYHRFGYVTTLANYSVVVDTLEATTFDNPFRVRNAKPGDIPAMQRMHEAQDAPVSCSLLRTSGHLKNKWEKWNRWQVLTDENGKVVAHFYAAPEGQHVKVSEVALDDIGLSPGILAATGAMAAEASLGHIRYHVPPSHPFARFLLQFKCRHEMQTTHDEGGMMRFINIAETLENLIPEWESLLGESVARDYRTEFTLVVDNACYRLRANRGAVDVALAPGKNKVSMTSQDLMHVVTGYRYLEDVLNARWSICTAEARQLMNTLFPKRAPYVWPFDRF